MDKPKIRVLIVSSPGILQRMLTSTFKRNPLIDVVDTASGGLSAIYSIDNHQPDVVVIDSNLPDKETLELIKIIQERRDGMYKLVLVETTHQLHQMTTAGADLAIRAEDLSSNLDDLLVELSARAGKKQV